MSLKAFHIFFILASFGICIFFGLWSLNAGADLSENYRWMGVASLAASAGLLAYLAFFIFKITKRSSAP